jgi:hypothetical protein
MNAWGKAASAGTSFLNDRMFSVALNSKPRASTLGAGHDAIICSSVSCPRLAELRCHQCDLAVVSATIHVDAMQSFILGTVPSN